jgi:hypothetical protein
MKLERELMRGLPGRDGGDEAALSSGAMYGYEGWSRR